MFFRTFAKEHLVSKQNVRKMLTVECWSDESVNLTDGCDHKIMTYDNDKIMTYEPHQR